MSVIETTCRRCGQIFTPDRQTILAGAWRLCPACRTPPPPPRLPSPASNAGARTPCARCLGVTTL